MTLAAGGINLDMFKNMDFDEVEDVTDLLETDEGFSSSDAFKNK
jgi:hypothetical protein